MLTVVFSGVNLFISDMNSLVYCSSRGRCLQSLACGGVFIYPGGKILRIFQDVERHLSLTQGIKIVYFVCGIPDVCELVRDKNSKYEESYIDTVVDEEVIVKTYMDKLEMVSNRIRNMGHHVVFATIVTKNFEKWNTHRLSVGKTLYLAYETQYPKMQERLNAVLLALNQRIVALNVKNQVATPLLHNYIHQRCQNGKIRYKYTKLIDGVHPSPDVGQKWFDHITSVIAENEHRLASV